MGPEEVVHWPDQTGLQPRPELAGPLRTLREDCELSLPGGKRCGLRRVRGVCVCQECLQAAAWQGCPRDFDKGRLEREVLQALKGMLDTPICDITASHAETCYE